MDEKHSETQLGTGKKRENTVGDGNTKHPPRSRNYCFTINNWTREDLNMVLDTVNTRYIVQEEKGEKGILHLQGFIAFKNPRTFEQVKLILPRAHIEKARNIKASIAYCQKTDTATGQHWQRGFLFKKPIPQITLDHHEKKLVNSIINEKGQCQWRRTLDLKIIKYLCQTYKSIYLPSNSAGKLGLKKYLEKHDNEIEIAIVYNKGSEVHAFRIEIEIGLMYVGQPIYETIMFHIPKIIYIDNIV